MIDAENVVVALEYADLAHLRQLCCKGGNLARLSDPFGLSRCYTIFMI